jgi:hypothetical protein
MKVVRERINEIRRELPGSGLGSIGVGSAGMCKAFIYAAKIQPFIKDEPTFDNNKIWLFTEGLRDFKKNMSKELNAPLENIIMLYKSELNALNLEYCQNLTDDDIHEVTRTIYDLLWDSRTTKMTITTNIEMGISHVFYYTREQMATSAYCFRVP